MLSNTLYTVYLVTKYLIEINITSSKSISYKKRGEIVNICKLDALIKIYVYI